MFGQEWLALQERPIFRKDTMDKIFEEIITREGDDPLKITNAFLPQKNFDSTELIALVKNATTGKTAPYTLGGNIPLTTVPGFYYKEYGITYWREGIYWSEKDMQLLKKPDKPHEPAGSDLMVMSQQTLAKRMNNRIEFLSGQTVVSGGWDVAENGINYRYLTGVPTWFYIKMGTTAHSSTVGVAFENAPWIATPSDNYLWSATATANPLLDIQEIVALAPKLGYVIDEIWMTPDVAALIQKATATQTWLKLNPQLVRDYITTALILPLLPSLGGVKITIDERRYVDATFLTAQAASGQAVLTAENGLITCDGGQDITLISPNGQYQARVKTHATTDPTATTITLSANLARTWEVGTQVIVSKPFLADQYGRDRYVVFKTSLAPELGNFAYTPSIVGGSFENPRPGKFTGVDFSQESSKPWIKVYAGFEGGPVVWNHGGYFVVQVR